MATLDRKHNLRRRALTGILEHAMASLELTKVQRDHCEEQYHECGDHLSEGLGNHPGNIFPQGSMRLGTVIRPYRDITDIFDLDVVFHLPLPYGSYYPEAFRTAVGVHLQQKYNGAVKPLPKGWRIDFSKEHNYHLDIIPAMNSTTGGNVIAITDADHWKDSNPRDYATQFESIAALTPKFEDELVKEGMTILSNANIEPLPEYTPFKSPLQRIVQITKRHRDYYFNKKTKQPKIATASIILTTLLAKAYAAQVPTRVYASGFDLLLQCVEDMPNHLEVSQTSRGIHYSLPNPSLPTENLVEKWADPLYEKGFFSWHTELILFLKALVSTEIPERRLLSETLGEAPVNSAFARQSESLNLARQNNVLTVSPNIGLTIGTGQTVSSKHVIHGIE
jgi:hypothetical protein